MSILITILIAISGVCWSVVYIECIRTAFKERTYCMPLFVLALNFAWEGIYAYTDLFIRNQISVQAIANTCWFVLDIFILLTWFRFGKAEFEGKKAKWFIPWSVIVIIIAFAIQFLFIAEFGSVEGEKYSAYLQNIAMSVSFLYMLNARGSRKGQSMTIAVCKCIGTLAPTIYGTIEGNMFILGTGIICCIFDMLYIYMLWISPDLIMES